VTRADVVVELDLFI